MPIIKSAQKKLRKDVARNKRNVTVKDAFKKAVKTIVQTAFAKKSISGKSVNGAYSSIDKAAKKGVIHRRKAARLKSRVAKLSAGSK